MLVKKYFIDLEHYDINADKIVGDMGFSFCDMPETMHDTMESAKEDIEYGINEEVNEYLDKDIDFGGYIDIYVIVEYTFDTEKFFVYDDGEVDEDYSLFNTEAIVGFDRIYAMCQNISDYSLYEKMNNRWKETDNFNIEMYK